MVAPKTLDQGIREKLLQVAVVNFASVFAPFVFGAVELSDEVYHLRLGVRFGNVVLQLVIGMKQLKENWKTVLAFVRTESV